MKHIKSFNENSTLFSNKQFQEIFFEIEDVLGGTITTDFNDIYYFISVDFPNNEFNIFQVHNITTIDAQLSNVETLRDIIMSAKKILQKLKVDGYETSYKIDNSRFYKLTFTINRDF